MEGTRRELNGIGRERKGTEGNGRECKGTEGNGRERKGVDGKAMQWQGPRGNGLQTARKLCDNFPPNVRKKQRQCYANECANSMNTMLQPCENPTTYSSLCDKTAKKSPKSNRHQQPTKINQRPYGSSLHFPSIFALPVPTLLQVFAFVQNV